MANKKNKALHRNDAKTKIQTHAIMALVREYSA